MYSMMRMEPDSFRSLVAHFIDTGLLRDSKHIDVEKKLVIFLHIIAHNMRNKAINTLFQHSAATTSKVFHKCLDAMIKFSKEMIVHTNFGEPPRLIRHHKKLREGVFRGVVGALDGTLIPASILVKDQTPYRGRGGGICFQNVMAICDFDMYFTYVVTGWEGVAHDSRVLIKTLNKPVHNFPMPPTHGNGHYLFVDVYHSLYVSSC
ncbi:hypothetical protein GIB67_020100 [Kingdonia uniflora]|uniref:DUF8040 domain-containing protein n=1 Tax=Kingdonia uniflora TaxID=39325 RepID=A0A7J7L2J9_9MAGN|nr:hypothetical protein GIB67_020100 [Kingdonia uniflora]